MKRVLMLSVAALGFAGVPAMAAPGVPSIAPTAPLAEKAQAFHRDCAWIGGRWGYRRGERVIVCRPFRPEGRGWVWHREGNRYGWWHSDRRAWHNDRW
jgi:hypothetical protein